PGGRRRHRAHQPRPPDALRGRAPGRAVRRRLDHADVTPMVVTKAICKTLPVTIRRAAPAELMACAQLYEHVGNATFTWRPKGWFKAADFLDHARNEEVYIAESHGAMLGLMSFFRPSNFIHSLYIAVSAQGFGIGTALIEAAEKIADGPL